MTFASIASGAMERLFQQQESVLVNSTLTVRKYLEQCIATCGRSQREIAQRCGYPNPNIITMFKTGGTKLPLNKAIMVAKAVDGDPAFLLRLALQEYMPETWEVIEELMGRDRLLSEGETSLVEYLREVGATDPIDLDVLENRRILGDAVQEIGHRDQRKAEAAVRAINSLPTNARHKGEPVHQLPRNTGSLAADNYLERSATTIVSG